MNNLTRLLALVALVASSAFAQSTSQYTFTSPTATTAPITLWVVAGGSNGNDCAQPTRPCKTPGGAFSKLPDFINHAVTIKVGAGTYTDSPTLHDKIIGRGGSIAIVGTGSPTISGAFAIVNVTGGAQVPPAGPVTLTGVTVTAASGTVLTTIGGVLNFATVQAPVPFSCDEDFASIPAGYFGTNPLPCTASGVVVGMPCSVGVLAAAPADGGSAWPLGANVVAVGRGAGLVELDVFNQLGDGGALNPPDAGYRGYCFP
jgi:hypothetical protein